MADKYMFEASSIEEASECSTKCATVCATKQKQHNHHSQQTPQQGESDGSSNKGGKAPLVMFKSISEHEKKIASLNQENFDLRLYCYNLEEKVKRQGKTPIGNSNSRAASQMEKEIRELRENIEQKAALLVKGSTALNELKSELEAALEEKRRLCCALGQQDCQLEELMKDNAVLCSASCHVLQQLHCLQEKFMASEDRRLELEDLSRRSSCDIAVLNAKLCECIDSLEQLTAERVQLEIELKLHRNSNCVGRQDGQFANEAQSSRIRDLTERLNQAQEELCRTLEESQCLRQHVQELQGKLNCLDSATGAEREQLDQRWEVNRHLEEQLQLIPRLRKDVELLENEDIELRAQLKLEQIRNEELCSQYESRLMQLQQQIKALITSLNFHPTANLLPQKLQQYLPTCCDQTVKWTSTREAELQQNSAKESISSAGSSIKSHSNTRTEVITVGFHIDPEVKVEFDINIDKNKQVASVGVHLSLDSPSATEQSTTDSANEMVWALEEASPRHTAGLACACSNTSLRSPDASSPWHSSSSKPSSPHLSTDSSETTNQLMCNVWSFIRTKASKLDYGPGTVQPGTHSSLKNQPNACPTTPDSTLVDFVCSIGQPAPADALGSQSPEFFTSSTSDTDFKLCPRDDEVDAASSTFKTWECCESLSSSAVNSACSNCSLSDLPRQKSIGLLHSSFDNSCKVQEVHPSGRSHENDSLVTQSHLCQNRPGCEECDH